MKQLDDRLHATDKKLRDGVDALVEAHSLGRALAIMATEDDNEPFHAVAKRLIGEVETAQQFVNDAIETCRGNAEPEAA